MLAWAASAVKIVLSVGYRVRQCGQSVGVVVGRVLAGPTTQDWKEARVRRHSHDGISHPPGFPSAM